MSPLGSKWETLVWPPWLPVRARLPLIAQIAGVVMLGALIAHPWWTALEHPPAVPQAATVAPVPTPAPAQKPAPPVQLEPLRPAHLNLDVRHSFRHVELTVSVDGKRALQVNLEGNGKKFGVFGKRAERGFTRTLDLEPGARVVRVRVRSASDKFDETRVERFDLGSASVAGLSITANKSGLSLAADRPVVPPAAPLVAAATTPPVPLAPVPVQAQAVTKPPPQAADVFIIELFKTLRQVLLAIAGFIASAATGFVVQEFLRSRKKLILSEVANLSGVRRRRDEDAPQAPAAG